MVSEEQINGPSSLFHLPVDRAELLPETSVALLTDPGSAGADRLRYMRMRLREIRTAAKLRTILITSPDPKDGKTTIAMSLATLLAEGGKRNVLLVEGDLHHPTIANRLGIQHRPGFAECLEDGLEPISQIRRIEPLAWSLLQAGRPRGNPTELLQSDRISNFIEELSSHFDWMLIDTAPVFPLTDALFLSRNVDGTLLVARAGRTSRESIEEAVNLLDRKRVLGIILNGTEGLGRLYSKYPGYYATT